VNIAQQFLNGASGIRAEYINSMERSMERQSQIYQDQAGMWMNYAQSTEAAQEAKDAAMTTAIISGVITIATAGLTWALAPATVGTTATTVAGVTTTIPNATGFAATNLGVLFGSGAGQMTGVGAIGGAGILGGISSLYNLGKSLTMDESPDTGSMASPIYLGHQAGGSQASLINPSRTSPTPTFAGGVPLYDTGGYNYGNEVPSSIYDDARKATELNRASNTWGS